MLSGFLFKLDPFNFVPFEKTPWGGGHISQLKNRYFPHSGNRVFDRIGESWEVSTDLSFLSRIVTEQQALNGLPAPGESLDSLIRRYPVEMLGHGFARFCGESGHSPLLLKWLSADDVLSVQVHPGNGDPLLAFDECGKPESWLVLDAEPEGFVYLGFREGLTRQQIVDCLLRDTPEQCLHRYEPKKFDMISVPPGCVHALGKGVFVAEPQFVLPGKSGKTWRLSDWGRLYDEHGAKVLTGDGKKGKPRALHTQEALHAIDWGLPKGEALQNALVQPLRHGAPFLGNSHNPFAFELFCEAGEFCYTPLKKGCFSAVSVFGGRVSFSFGSTTVTLRGGESAFLAASWEKECVFRLAAEGDDKPCLAFFSVDQNLLGMDFGS